ncbi:nucleotide exchange factor GrpE [Sesbania bispinosa]|nr:nucleotide exchange factor GrpE [Sesbania bispinosa]
MKENVATLEAEVDPLKKNLTDLKAENENLKVALKEVEVEYKAKMAAAKEEKDKFVLESLSSAQEAFDLAITQVQARNLDYNLDTRNLSMFYEVRDRIIVREGPSGYEEVLIDLMIGMEQLEEPSRSVRGDDQGDGDDEGHADNDDRNTPPA